MIRHSDILKRKHNKAIIFSILFFVGVLMILYSLITETVPYRNNEKLSVVVLDLSKIKTTYIIGGLFLLISSFFFLYDYLKTIKKTDVFSKLTLTETKVISLIKEEKYNKEIADELNISLSTVKTHINNIYRKLDISSRSELMEILKK